MASQPDGLVGKVVGGRYRVLSRLGQGGMGTVYLALHEAIEKKVALKVLRPEYSAKPDLVARFQREAISASRIKHPNVLDVFDFGQTDDGCFFLAMEFLEGRDLADELEHCRVLTSDHALRVTLQICKALAVAHGKGVVHRDLKPENVFLQITADGEESVKIVDFGIAQLRSTEEAAANEPSRRRLTRTGMIFGTPEYMSPEQAAGKKVDSRVDIYATGIILYEMLTGAVPFTGDTFFAVLNSHLHDPLPTMRSLCPDVAVSPELEQVVARALVKNPAERFQTMRELASALMSTPEAHALDPLARKSAIPEAVAEPIPAPTAAPSPPTRAEAPTDPERAARADTLPAAMTAVEPPPKPGAGKAVWVALGVVVVAALGVATVKLLPSRGTDATASPSAEQPPVLAPPKTSLVEVTPTAAPSVSTALPPENEVRLQIETDPAGGVVYKGGFQVCDSAPCEVLAKKNETLTLEAKKGALRGTAKVLAQSDQKVSIRLTSAPAKGVQPCYQEVIEGELKTMKPVPCK